MESPTVLVLLATYNGEKYINEMVDSIIAQDYTDWHLILSDDSSSDSTPQILEDYAQKYPEKIKAFFKENGGQARQRKRHRSHRKPEKEAADQKKKQPQKQPENH